MDRHADAAALLLSAWRDPTQLLTAFPAVLVPVDEAHAYAVQRRVAEGLESAGGAIIGGWKVGAPKPDRPNCAPMPAAGIYASPARVSAKRFTLRGVEGEIAFRLGADLKLRDEPYGRAEIVAAIACCVPAIEILQSRFTNPDDEPPLAVLADSNTHGGFVYGPPAADWQGIDFAAETVRLTVGGAVVKTGTANPLGDMIRLIQWLADTGSRWAGGLKAGQYITCGSWTGKDFVAANAQVQVTFAHAGSVSLEFTP